MHMKERQGEIEWAANTTFPLISELISWQSILEMDKKGEIVKQNVKGLLPVKTQSGS